MGRVVLNTGEASLLSVTNAKETQTRVLLYCSCTAAAAAAAAAATAVACTVAARLPS